MLKERAPVLDWTIATVEDIRDQDPLDQIEKKRVDTVRIDEAIADEVKVVDVVKVDVANVAIDMMIEEEMRVNALKVAVAAREMMTIIDKMTLKEGTAMIVTIEETRIINQLHLSVITMMTNDVNIQADEDRSHPEIPPLPIVDQVGHIILHLPLDTTPQDQNIKVVREVKKTKKMREAIEPKGTNLERGVVRGVREEDKIEDSRG